MRRTADNLRATPTPHAGTREPPPRRPWMSGGRSAPTRSKPPGLADTAPEELETTLRALIIRHDHASLPGFVGERLADRGFDLEVITVVPAERFHAPSVDCDFPNVHEYDLIVPLGAPWSVNDRTTIGSWVDDELKMLGQAHGLGIPIFGICFGAQALATALGGAVEAAPRPEIGWMRIETDLPGLIPAGPWFQSHFDRFVVPPGAKEVARTAVGPQAFHLGRTLGIQFHPELTGETLRAWFDLGLYDQALELGLDPDGMLERTRELSNQAQQQAHTLVDGFLDRVALAPLD